jgi:hypothetical protein
MGESRYRKKRIIFCVIGMGEENTAMVGVSIMVIKPLNISDIILAIFVLAIVYSNGKVCVCKV